MLWLAIFPRNMTVASAHPPAVKTAHQEALELGGGLDCCARPLLRLGLALQGAANGTHQ